MRFLKFCTILLGIMVQLITGCGGGGSGGNTVTLSSTKTETLKLSSNSTNPADLIGGFDLTVILPVGSVLQTDTNGVPLSSKVFLSGQFAGSIPQIVSYDRGLRKLTVSYASLNDYKLGEFITVLVTVPSSYVPNVTDIDNALIFKAFAPLTGADMPFATATATFN